MIGSVSPLYSLPLRSFPLYSSPIVGTPTPTDPILGGSFPLNSLVAGSYPTGTWTIGLSTIRVIPEFIKVSGVIQRELRISGDLQ